jgi:hypothetical protein
VSHAAWGSGTKTQRSRASSPEIVDPLPALRAAPSTSYLSYPWTAVWENRPVLVSRQPRLPLTEIWPKTRRWG